MASRTPLRQSATHAPSHPIWRRSGIVVLALAITLIVPTIPTRTPSQEPVSFVPGRAMPSATSDPPAWVINATDISLTDSWGDGTWIYACGYGYVSTYRNGYILKCSTAGVLQWSYRYSLSVDSTFTGIWGDGTGIYTTGHVVRSGEANLLLVKWDTDGGISWERERADAGNDYGKDIWGDGANIYTCGSYQVSGQTRSLLHKWSTSGTVAWSLGWPDGTNDRATSVSGDSSNVYVSTWIGVGSRDNVGIIAFTKAGLLAWNVSYDNMHSSDEPRLCANGNRIFVVMPYPYSSGEINIFDTAGQTKGMRFLTRSYIPTSISCNANAFFIGGIDHGSLVLQRYDAVSMDAEFTRIWGGITYFKPLALWMDGANMFPTGRSDSTGDGLLARWAVDATPAPSFTIDPSSPIHASPVAAAASGFLGDLPATCYWRVDGSGPSYSGTNPTISFPTPGIHVLTLTVTDNDGDSATFAGNVTVGLDLLPTIAPIWPNSYVGRGEVLSIPLDGSEGNGVDVVRVILGDSNMEFYHDLPDHVEIAYEKTGIFDLIIEIVDSDGDVARASFQVHVVDWWVVWVAAIAGAILVAVIIYIMTPARRRAPPRAMPLPPPYEPHVLIGTDRLLVTADGTLDATGRGLVSIRDMKGFERAAPYVKSLDISRNELASLDGIEVFTSAQQINASGNHIVTIMKANVPLETTCLDVSSNRLAQVSLPISQELTALNLANNDLEDLPGLGGGERLVYLKLDGNKFLAGLIDELGGLDDDGFAKDPCKIVFYGNDRGYRQSIRRALQIGPPRRDAQLANDVGQKTAPEPPQLEQVVVSALRPTPPAVSPATDTVDRWPVSLNGLIAGLRRKVQIGIRVMSLGAITDACAASRDVDKEEVERLLGLLVKGDVVSRTANEFRLGEILRVAAFWGTIDKLLLGQVELGEVLEMLAPVGTQQKLVYLMKMYSEEPRLKLKKEVE